MESDRLQRPDDDSQEAFALWSEFERAEILAQIDIAEAQLARGESRSITNDSMRQLAEEVMQRGRNRVADEIQPSR